jgi:hypothetical protein
MKPEEMLTLYDQHQRIEDGSPGIKREILARHGFQIVPCATSYDWKTTS